MTIYDDINRRAEERRRQQSVDPLIRKVYRDDEKITSQISAKDYRSQIDDPQSLGILNTEDSLRTLTTERTALLIAGGVLTHEDTPPLVDKPNKYTGKKFCRACKTWKQLSQFSPLATTFDGKHTYCRACRAEKARKSYVPVKNWKRSK